MATLKLKDGLVQNSNSFTGDFTVDTNDRSMAVGPIEVSKLKKSSDVSNPENIHALSASDLIKLNKQNNFVSLVIGPEGGFSIDELLFSCKNKFSFICLGGRILRMETVPIALISILQSIFGDF